MINVDRERLTDKLVAEVDEWGLDIRLEYLRDRYREFLDKLSDQELLEEEEKDIPI